MKRSLIDRLQEVRIIVRSYLKFGISAVILLCAGFANAQWIRKADAQKTRSEVSSVVYKNKLYAFLGFGDSLLNAEPGVEVYDPVSNIWSPLTPIEASKSMTHQGVVLIDDKVWHIGGRVGENPAPLTSEIWIYNITSDSWSPGPMLKDPATAKPLLWGGGGAALLGRTLHIFGGFVNTACNNDQDKYHLTLNVDEWMADPSKPAAWKNELAPLPLKRNHFGTAVLAGKIYAIGGQFGHDCDGGLDQPYSHVYDPASNTWAELPLLSSPRSHIEGSTFTLDGKIFIFAGQSKNGINTNLVSVFDPAGNNGAGSWKDDKDLLLPSSYEGLSAKVIGDKLFISHGGEGSSRNARNLTYMRTLSRNPVEKIGFLSKCLSLNNLLGSTIKQSTWLYTIEGLKNYRIVSNAGWLKITKNSTGIVNPNAVKVELTANTAGLSPGDYKATLTAVTTGNGNDSLTAVLCVNLTVYPADETVSSFVTAISVSTYKTYPLALLNTNTRIYTDRNTQVTLLPDELTNAAFIRTVNNDKNNTNPALLSFTVSKNATVYIAYDPRAKTLPLWLTGFQKLGSQVAITDAKISHMEVYAKNYQAGRIVLGGNQQNPATGALNNYFVIVVPLAPGQNDLQVTVKGGGQVLKNPVLASYKNGTSVTLTATADNGLQFSGWSGSINSNANPLTLVMDADKSLTASFIPDNLVTNVVAGSNRKYILGKLLSGNTVYTDRSYLATTVPVVLNNASLIKTPIDDKDNIAAEVLSFTLMDSAVVYVAYDPRATSLPAWLSGWQKKNDLRIYRQDPRITYMTLYSKAYPAGKVSLGGNLQSPARGSLCNYFVIVTARSLQNDTTLHKRGNQNTDTGIATPGKIRSPATQSSPLQLSVYPNPNPGSNIYVEGGQFPKNEIITITLRDAPGNVIESMKVISNSEGAFKKSMKFKRAAKGLYFISAISPLGKAQKKLLVN